MRRNCLLVLFSTLLMLSFAATSFAQDDKPRRKDLVDSTGDPDSFGSNVRFMGLVNAGVLILDPTCDPTSVGELSPDDRCIVLNPSPAPTSFDVRDLGRVTLPGNSAKNIVYFVANHTWSYQFLNQTGIHQNDARFQYTPYVTVESDALKDPRAVDPITNLPLNGKIDLNIGGGHSASRSLDFDERIREQLNYTRAGFGGFSKATFVSSGIPADIVDKMFRQQMTIRLNLRGQVRHVSDALMFYNMRLMGN